MQYIHGFNGDRLALSNSPLREAPSVSGHKIGYSKAGGSHATLAGVSECGTLIAVLSPEIATTERLTCTRCQRAIRGDLVQESVYIRMPTSLAARCRQRAAQRNVSLSTLLRAYVLAGDAAEEAMPQ